jgi:AbrB family looped-hinge helix DNA binding protein
MAMPTATITSKGQTTIPKAVRTRLRLKAGDRVEFLVQDDGTALMVPATVRVVDLEGILPAPDKPVSVEEMNRAIRKRGGKL